MTANTRGLYRPRRMLVRPRGIPRIIAALAPRGLRFCAIADAGLFRDVAFGRPLSNSTNTAPKSTLRGPGVGQLTATDWYDVFPADNPSTVSVELLLRTGSQITGRGLCGWNNNNAMNSGTNDKELSITAGGKFDWYTAGPGHATGAATVAANTFYHLVGVADASNLFLYVNGKQDGTLAGGGSYNGYGTPFFGIGRDNSDASADAVILLANYANVPWTAAEVLARYLNPFGFLAWPEDRRHYLVGVSSATSFVYFDLTNPDVTFLLRKAEMVGY